MIDSDKALKVVEAVLSSQRKVNELRSEVATLTQKLNDAQRELGIKKDALNQFLGI